MVGFVALAVPLEQAAHELVEMESHVEGSGVDPFDEFGDPQELATSVVPIEQRRQLYRTSRTKPLRNKALVVLLRSTSLHCCLTNLFGSSSARRVLIWHPVCNEHKFHIQWLGETDFKRSVIRYLVSKGSPVTLASPFGPI